MIAQAISISPSWHKIASRHLDTMRMRAMPGCMDHPHKRAIISPVPVRPCQFARVSSPVSVLDRAPRSSLRQQPGIVADDRSATLAAGNLPAAIAAYVALLGRRDARPTSDRSLQLVNGSLQLPPPTQRAGLTEVTFAVADLDAAQILLARRCLPTRRVAAHDWSAGDALLARPVDRRILHCARCTQRGDAGDVTVA
jgi:hypothetical protein